MTGPDALPVELLFAVINHACFADLLRASHVCRFWHSVARDHPHFWHDVRLRAASPGAVECFLSRLASHSTQPVSVDIVIGADGESDRHQVVDQILPALRANVHRLDDANLFFPRALAHDVLRCLEAPAPCLAELSLGFSAELDNPIVPLSADLFTSHSPVLRKVNLRNVLLPIPVPAIRAVVDLAYHTSATVPFPVSLLQPNTRIRRLWLHASAFILPPSLDSAVRDAIARLEMILLPYAPDQDEMVALLDLMVVREVILAPPKVSAGRIAMAHLDGPLGMSIMRRRTADVDMHIVFASISSGRRRVFWDWEADFHPPDGNNALARFYFDTRYIERVKSLAVAGSFWALFAEHVHHLPRCTALTIVLDDLVTFRQALGRSVAVTCPVLDELVLEDTGDGLSASDLVRTGVSVVTGQPSSSRLIVRHAG